MHQADQCSPGREAGDKALRAIDRIENPDIFGIFTLAAEFLANDAVMPKGFADKPPHGDFGRAVRLRNRIENRAAAFVFRPDRGPEEWQDGLPGEIGELFDESGKVDGGHVSLNLELADHKASLHHAEPSRHQNQPGVVWEQRS